MMETVVWVGLGLSLPWLARRLRARVLDPREEGWHDVEWLARAAYGALLPFGAWASGELVGRELGLQPLWRGDALLGLATVAGVVVAGEWVLRRIPTRPTLLREIGEDRSPADLFDTPRWSLYRGVGLLWTGDLAWLRSSAGSWRSWKMRCAQAACRIRPAPRIAAGSCG